MILTGIRVDLKLKKTSREREVFFYWLLPDYSAGFPTRFMIMKSYL